LPASSTRHRNRSALDVGPEPGLYLTASYLDIAYFVIISIRVPRSTGPSYLGAASVISLSSSIGSVSPTPFFLFPVLTGGRLACESRKALSAASRSERPAQGPHVLNIKSAAASSAKAAAAGNKRHRPSLPAAGLLPDGFRSCPCRPVGCPWLFRIALWPGAGKVSSAGKPARISPAYFPSTSVRSQDKEKGGMGFPPRLWVNEKPAFGTRHSLRIHGVDDILIALVYDLSLDLLGRRNLAVLLGELLGK